MKRILAAAVAVCAMAVPGLAAESLNVPAPGAPKAAQRVAIGDRGMAIMSAAINGADGTIARGEGVVATGTTRLSTGVYEVGFGRDVTECVYSMTAGESGIGSATPRLVGITRRSGNPSGVFVQIRDATNTAVDSDFFVLVYCGR